MKNKKPIKNDKEVRYITGLEIRQDSEDKMTLKGYALTFDTETLIGSEEYGYIEKIDRNAFNETDMKKVPLKYNHAGSYLAIASTKNGSLTLTVDEKGLKFEADLIDTTSNRDVYKMVQEGLLSECSFAFTVDYENGGSLWEELDGDMPRRTVLKVKRLYDVALVDIPAYENTEVYARSLEVLEDLQKTAEAEKREKEAFSRRMKMKIKLNLEEKK